MRLYVGLILIKKVGHYYWLEEKTGKIIISDESADDDSLPGDFVIGHPEKTDDGVLYLDRERLKGWKSSRDIPIIYPDGKKSLTIGNKEELDFVKYISKFSQDEIYEIT
jgi:hypothetical protein